jgi:uncharacterized membrane protein
MRLPWSASWRKKSRRKSRRPKGRNRIGALTGAGAAGAAGRWIDEGFSAKFLANLQQYLQPGSSALVLLMEHEWVQKAAEAMAGLEGIVFQQTITDTLVEDLLEAVPETGDKQEEK